MSAVARSTQASVSLQQYGAIAASSAARASEEQRRTTARCKIRSTGEGDRGSKKDARSRDIVVLSLSRVVVDVDYWRAVTRKRDRGLVCMWDRSSGDQRMMRDQIGLGECVR